jgi:hypothetical protein
MRVYAREHPYLIRLIAILVFSTLFVAGFNEATYLLQKEDFDRLPKTVSLTIPEGTAELVRAGGSVPGIPEEMVFVVGDVLEVHNQDLEAHQLGPVWVPPGGTSRLAMEEANKYSYACSFQPAKYLGLDVRKGTTLKTRITALALAAPTMSALLFIYSLAAFPIKEKEKAAKAPQQAQAPAEAEANELQTQVNGNGRPRPAG